MTTMNPIEQLCGSLMIITFVALVLLMLWSRRK
jgi:hypothetical protein